MQQKHTLKDWIVATRPWSFTASGLTVLTALFYLRWLTGEVDWQNGLLAVLGIILFHAAGNVEFALASLGNDAGAYGAFKLAMDAFGK
jgi:1,4-dihydroxy-2-naphthoate octaprenyltransferase